MTCSVADSIKLVTARIPEHCVTPAAVTNVTDLACLLPSIFASYYLEYRLQKDDDQVDFLAALRAPATLAEQTRLRSAVANPRSKAQTDETDERSRLTRGALLAWSDPARAWKERIPFVWLEIDHAGRKPPVEHIPSFCICVDPRYPKLRSSNYDRNGSYRLCADFLVDVSERVELELVQVDALRTVERCFRSLPAGGRIIHVSVMVARDPVTVKLYGCVPTEALPTYLSSIGWSGSESMLGDVMRSFCTPATSDDFVYFDLAVGGSLLPYIAIAFSQLQIDPNRGRDPARESLLSSLEKRGLCSAEKRLASLTWPGAANEIHPEVTQWARVTRWLDVKVVITPSAVSAKGYLGFAPGPPSMFS